MAETSPDASANTEQFRKFVDTDQFAEPVGRRNATLILGIGAVVVVIALVAVVLAVK